MHPHTKLGDSWSAPQGAGNTNTQPAGPSAVNPSLLHRTGGLGTGTLMTGLAAPCVFTDPGTPNFLPVYLQQVSAASIQGAMWLEMHLVTSSHIIQGSKGEALSMSLLKDEQHFSSSCPTGQGTVCGHSNTGPWQGAWNAGKEFVTAGFCEQGWEGKAIKWANHRVHPLMQITSSLAYSFPCFSIHTPAPAGSWNSFRGCIGPSHLNIKCVGLSGVTATLLCHVSKNLVIFLPFCGNPVLISPSLEVY